MTDSVKGMTSLQVKAEVLCYLRFQRQVPLVAVEFQHQDIVWVAQRRSAIVEVKVSIGDLKADFKKDWHTGIRWALDPALHGAAEGCYWGSAVLHGRGSGYGQYEVWAPNQFWFAVPDYIQDSALKVIESLYPYAGLLACRAVGYSGGSTEVIRKPKELHTRRASKMFVARLVKGQSASLANAYTHRAKEGVR